MPDKSADLISIIMPCYNAESYIKESVSSALGQSYKNSELIIVNDGSTDKSLKVLKDINDPRIKIISQPNKGVCKARNRGIAAATGDYIAFLDADDNWHPDCLKRLHSALKSQPNAMVAYCGWQNTGLSGGRGRPHVPPDYERPDKIETLLGGCRWPIHAALTRRTAIEEAGGFDERWTSCMDYDLWLRLASSHDIVLVPEVLAYYRHHEGTRITNNRVRGAINHWRIQKEFLSQHPEIFNRLGRRRIREFTCGELLRRGYICYWDRDLKAASAIFRMVMKTGYGSLKDWKYLLPSLLPLPLHRVLIKLFSRDKGTGK